jgi:N-acetylglucosamine-6-phosphate deacetylase
MIILSGADLVLPDRIVSSGTLVIEAGRIVEIDDRQRPSDARVSRHDLHGHLIIPGLIDVHVHGAEGTDTLGPSDAIRTLAALLPRHGVTAFCPTSLACDPATLRRMLAAVRDARSAPGPRAARVLPAHLESNFVNPEFAGAQPVECLRRPPAILETLPGPDGRDATSGHFTGEDILAEITRARPDVGIVTVAPELDGAVTRGRPTKRRERASTPAHVRPRISSIGCRHCRIARRGSPARSSNLTKSPPS